MKQRWNQLTSKAKAASIIGVLVALFIIGSIGGNDDDKATPTSTPTAAPSATQTSEFNAATALLRCKEGVQEKAGFDIRLVRSFTGEIKPGTWRFRGDVESAAGESTDLIFGCDVTEDDIKVEVVR